MKNSTNYRFAEQVQTFDWDRVPSRFTCLVMNNLNGYTYLAKRWRKHESVFSLSDWQEAGSMGSIDTHWTLISRRTVQPEVDAVPPAPTYEMHPHYESTHNLVPSPAQLGARFFESGYRSESNPFLGSPHKFNQFLTGFRNAESAYKARTQPYPA